MAVTFAQIEPTTRCNFTCGFCAGRSMRQGDLAWDAFVAFLDANPALRHVELQGEGEPLLHPRFFDMAAMCVDRNIRVSIITNGSLFGEERVERLLRSGISSIHVSIESADAKTFQAIRGGAFAKVRDGLARLVRRRAELGLERPVIGFAVTLLRDTLADIDRVLQMYRALGLDGGIVAQQLQSMPVYSRNYDAVMRAQLLRREDAPRFAAIRHALAREAPVPGVGDFFYHALFDGFDPARHSCPWLAKGAYLASDGSVATCCFSKNPAHALGAAGDAMVAIRRETLRDTLDEGTIPDACAGCSTAIAVARTTVSRALLSSTPA